MPKPPRAHSESEEDDSLGDEDSSVEEDEDESLLVELVPSLVLEELSSSLLLLSLSALELLLGTGRGGRGCHTRGERSIPS
jgi:hypothetical protein